MFSVSNTSSCLHLGAAHIPNALTRTHNMTQLNRDTETGRWNSRELFSDAKVSDKHVASS